MALERDIIHTGQHTGQAVPPVGQASAEDRILDGFDEDSDGRSNVVAFLLGGVVIAGGLLAFLYYDSDTINTRDITTGSITRLDQPAPGTGLSRLPLQPTPAR